VSVYDPGPHGFATNGKQAPTNRGPDWTDFLGAVYVFTRTDESWKKQAFLRPAIDDWRDFGDEISVSADGNLFVANSVRGVEVFELTEGEWEFKVSLSPNNGQRAGGFGASISLSSDSSTLAIGAPREHRGATGIEGYQGDENPKRESGAVYVFTHSDGIWRQLSYVKASNSQAGIRFGSAVSLSASGDTMVVGASAEFNTTTGINGDQYDETTKAKDAGAVYLY